MTTRSGRGKLLRAVPHLPREPMRRRFACAPEASVSALAVALLFGGCAAVGPDFKRPEVPWLAGWSSGSLDSLTAEERGLPKAQTEEWWRNFNDPVLDHLVAEAQRVNPDVRTLGCASWRHARSLRLQAVSSTRSSSR